MRIRNRQWQTQISVAIRELIHPPTGSERRRNLWRIGIECKAIQFLHKRDLIGRSGAGASTIGTLKYDCSIEQNMNFVKMRPGAPKTRLPGNAISFQPRVRSSFARSAAADVMNPRSPPPSTNLTPIPM